MPERVPHDLRHTISTVLAVGSLIDGKYEIRGHLGGGGMGDVYLARRTMLGDDVALKLIRPSPDPSGWRERFFREARACAQLRHPNIVSVLDFSIDAQGQPYLVMEHLNGPSLADELGVRRRFDIPALRQVARAIGGALSLAHASGMAHRDLKPQNVVSHRFQSGEIVYKVIDFGLVTLRAGDDQQTPITAAHEFLGTVAYAAPEQFTGATADARSDQYSFGVIAYELLAGKRPLDGDGLMAMVDSHLNQAPRPLADVRPDVPPSISTAIMRALEKTPDRRWPSVAHFVHALTDGDGEETVSADMPASALLGTYDLGAVIGTGRFGSEIHAGTHRALGLPVAIRLLKTSGRDDRDALRERFLREARALQIPHPNLLQVRDFGQDGDRLYLVTDLLPGVSLAERLSRDGPLPLATLNAFMRQIVEAAGALNRRGSFISGLHPGIIRLVADGDGERVVISTAGVSQIQDVLSTIDESTLRAQAGDMTELQYVAPEILTGQSANARADLYTIGALGYEMATGRRPYDARSLPSLLGLVFAGPPPSPGTLRADLPDHQSTALLRALARDPSDRFHEGAAFLSAWTAAGAAA